MALMVSFNTHEQNVLLSLAARSIQHGLLQKVALPVHKDNFSEKKLILDAACFVTLEISHQLRGCVGSLQAVHPLVSDVAHNAFAAAFEDSRFPPLTEKEFNQLDIHISVISKALPMKFSSEEDLLSQLQPGIDGLILSDNFQRGTFLPSVWDALPDARQFLNQLKVKARFTTDYWSDTLKIERYTTFSFGTHISNIKL